VDPQGSRVYVGNAFSNTISVIDAATSTTVAAIGGSGWGTAGLSVHPTAPQLWVASEDVIDWDITPGVVVIDTSTIGTSSVTWEPVALQHYNTSFGTFITGPVAQDCNDGPVEQALRTVEEAIRKSLDARFTLRGRNSAERVRGLGYGVKALNRGHLTGVYQHLLRGTSAAAAADQQICDDGLKAAVEETLSGVQASLRVIDKKFYLRGSTVAQLQSLADALAALEHGRLKGLYGTLR
jgi:YVTN family beta-propeller protein